MGVAKNRAEFRRAAEGLPVYDGPKDAEVDVICTEPTDPHHFVGGYKPKCIVRVNHRLFLKDDNKYRD